MADNINPRAMSAKDAAMAEVLISEIEKLTEVHNKTLENYQAINRLIDKNELIMSDLKNYITRVSDYVEKYAIMTQVAIELSEALIEIHKEGIGVSEEGRNTLQKMIKDTNKPIRLFLKYLLYGIGFILVTLFGLTIYINLL